MKKLINLLVVYIFLSASVTYAQDTGILEVSGKALIEEIPQNVKIVLTLTIRDSIYEDCNEQLISALNSMLAELEKADVREELLVTTGFRLDRESTWSSTERKRMEVGYKGTVKVIVEDRYSPALVGSVINTAKKNKYEPSYALHFQLSKDQKADIRSRVLKMAVENARKNAVIMAKAGNVELLEIQQISYGSSYYRSDVMIEDEEKVFSANFEVTQDLELRPEPESVYKSVHITWKIRDLN